MELSLSPDYKSIIALVAAFITLTILIVRYLSRNEGLAFKIKEMTELQRQLKSTFKSSITTENFDEIIRELDAVKKAQSALTEEQKEELVISIKEKLSKDTAKEILAQIEKEVEEKYLEDKKYKYINESFKKTTNRLKEELFSLSKRGNINLALGIMTTVMGLGLLGTFVLSTVIPSKPELTNQFIYEFIPRISLVILIEIFAYFFLRLYKENLSEIKYFQNEITTIEMKQQALYVAFSVSDKEAIKLVVQNLVSTERNFILSKGQSTIDIERAKIEQQSSDTILGKAADIIKVKSKKT